MDTQRQISPPIKLSWVEKARQVDTFHALKIKQYDEKNERWTITHTAQSLNRSYGSVAEDIMLVDWFRSHPRLELFRSRRTALEYIKEKKKKMRLREA